MFPILDRFSLPERVECYRMSLQMIPLSTPTLSDKMAVKKLYLSHVTVQSELELSHDAFGAMMHKSSPTGAQSQTKRL